MARGDRAPFVTPVPKLTHNGVDVFDGGVEILQEGGVLGGAAGAEELDILEMSDILVILRPFGIRMDPSGPWDQLDDYAENSGGAGGVGRIRRGVEAGVKRSGKGIAVVARG